MSALVRLGWLAARAVAVLVTLASAWLFVINVVELDYDGLILVWILVSGVVGAAGGPIYLLSIDGPSRFRTRVWRGLGWAAMLAAMLLPSSLSFFLLPMVALLIPTLFKVDRTDEEAVTSS